MASNASDDPNRGLVLSATLEPATAVEHAVAAEAAGWDGVFQIDHLVDFTAEEPGDHASLNDPWTVWAAVAARTERLTLGSYVTPIPRRQPWQLARDLATLDRLSDGRVLLGTGLGAPWDFEAFGEEYDQRRLAGRYDEALDVLVGLWTGEPFSYDGEHYTLEEAVLRPTPVQEPRIPIVVGGWWPFKGPFRRAARWDGVIPQWPSKFIGMPWVEGMGDHMAAVVPEEPAHEAEVRDLVGYYRDQADEPGEVVIPVDVPDAPPDFASFCEELGATWTLHDPAAAEDREPLAFIRDGPSG